MTLSTVVFIGTLVWGGMQADILPTPATKEYVNAQITQATKGLPYLVRSSIEKDLDNARYLVVCMHRAENQGALARLEDQYKELVGSYYQHKTCSDLEAMLQAQVSR